LKAFDSKEDIKYFARSVEVDEIKEFKKRYYLSDDDIKQMKQIDLPPVRLVQDYKSTYNDIRVKSIIEVFLKGGHFRNNCHRLIL